MTAPNVYELGGKIEIDLTPYDTEGVPFIPTYARLTIEEPDGTMITYSGGFGVSGGELTTASGFLYTLYKAPQRGWYSYEQWAADSTGREGMFTGGFEVSDIIRN